MHWLTPLLEPRFSAMVHALQDVLQEMDVNPIMVGPHQAAAACALALPVDLSN